jgi:hypothetical protein
VYGSPTGTPPTDPSFTKLMRTQVAKSYDEPFTDANANGKYDTGELFTDKNANGKRDVAIVEGVAYARDANPNDQAHFTQVVTMLTDSLNSDIVKPNSADNFAPDAILGSALGVFNASMWKIYKQTNQTIFWSHRQQTRSQIVIDTLGDLANGMRGVTPVVTAPSESGTFFGEAMKAVSGSIAASDDAQFYDATTLLMLATLQAVESGKISDIDTVTGKQIRDGLMHVSESAGALISAGPDGFAQAAELLRAGKPINYDGASGPVDFDAVGNVKGNYSLFEVQNKSFVDVMFYDCVKDAACPERLP